MFQEINGKWSLAIRSVVLEATWLLWLYHCLHNKHNHLSTKNIIILVKKYIFKNNFNFSKYYSVYLTTVYLMTITNVHTHIQICKCIWFHKAILFLLQMWANYFFDINVLYIFFPKGTNNNRRDRQEKTKQQKQRGWTLSPVLCSLLLVQTAAWTKKCL